MQVEEIKSYELGVKWHPDRNKDPGRKNLRRLTRPTELSDPVNGKHMISLAMMLLSRVSPGRRTRRPFFYTVNFGI